MDLHKNKSEPKLQKIQNARGVLRFLTCGSVDDGKSTLIGRLLYDSKLIFDDKLKSLEAISKKHGTAGDEIDYALLLDGLEAELEQGITIDVAYCYFSSPKRKFIVADTPGHEQYTRNMATGASTSDLAIILVDARKGILEQTIRHTYIAHILGVKHVVIAINKMDLIDYSPVIYHQIVSDYMEIAEKLDFETLLPIPISARYGDNITTSSKKTNWYGGETLLNYLENLDISTSNIDKPFRMPVQWVNRPDLDFRGLAGTIVSGKITKGDSVLLAKSGKTTSVKEIKTFDGELDNASSGKAVTLILNEELDSSRGDVICSPDSPMIITTRISAHILWMQEDSLLPGRIYVMKIYGNMVRAKVLGIEHRVSVNNLEKKPTKSLKLNQIGLCNIELSEPLPFDLYEEYKDTGAFILIDRFTNQTAGAGMIVDRLRLAEDGRPKRLNVSKSVRAAKKEQKPFMLWFTGPIGVGKTTVASLIEEKITLSGYHAYVLDADYIRKGLCSDLRFREADRIENIRRIAETGKILVDSGLIAICSLISPYSRDRAMARELMEEDEFIEIFLDAPPEVCRKRDKKALYERAKAGEIRNIIGYDRTYEKPDSPDLQIDTTKMDANETANYIIDFLKSKNLLTKG